MNNDRNISITNNEYSEKPKIKCYSEDESTEDQCSYVSQVNKISNKLNLAHGKANGGEVSVLRDAGCTFIIVSAKHVSSNNLIGQIGALRVANGKKYKVPKAKIDVNSL